MLLPSLPHLKALCFEWCLCMTSFVIVVVHFWALSPTLHPLGCVALVPSWLIL
jgi:hypothetical protein